MSQGGDWGTNCTGSPAEGRERCQVMNGRVLARPRLGWCGLGGIRHL